MGMGGNQDWMRGAYGGSRPWMGDSMGQSRPYGGAYGGGYGGKGMGMPQFQRPNAISQWHNQIYGSPAGGVGGKGGGKGGGIVDRVQNNTAPQAIANAAPQSAVTQQYRPFAQPEVMGQPGPVPVNPYAGPGVTSMGGGQVSPQAPVTSAPQTAPPPEPAAPEAPQSKGSYWDLLGSLTGDRNGGQIGWLGQRNMLNYDVGDDGYGWENLSFNMNNPETRKWIEAQGYSL